PEREAAALCLSCSRTFCRECVTEHEGRVLCSRCMVKGREKAGARRRFLSWAGPAFLGSSGLLFAWIFFYYLGLALARIPAAWHPGG
ncbi:MAG: rhomboid family protein, partial [Pseudomonadota bacterium]